MVTKILGFNNAGVFSLAISLSNTFSTFALYGMRSFQVSDTNQEYNSNTYISSRKLTCLVSLIVCLAFVFVNNYSNFQRLCIIAYMIFKTSETFVDVYHGIDQQNMRMDIIGKSYIFRGIITSVVFVGVIAITRNLLLGILALSIIAYLFVFLYDKRMALSFYQKKKISFTYVKKLLIMCLPVVVFSFITTLFTTVPRYFLERHLGNELLGIYASIALPVVLVQVLATYIFNPFITIFAEHYNNNDIKSFKKLFLKIVGVLVVLAIASILGAMILGKLGLKILFGEEIIKYTYLLIPLVWCTILTAFTWFLFTIATVLRDFKSLIIAGIVSALVCFVGSPLFVKKFGLNGASYINILSLGVQITMLIIFIYVFLKRKNEKGNNNE